MNTNTIFLTDLDLVNLGITAQRMEPVAIPVGFKTEYEWESRIDLGTGKWVIVDIDEVDNDVELERQSV